MLLLISVCSFPWWLWWLLPFLLGLLLGWLLWGRLKGRIAELEAELAKLRGQLRGLEGDLAECTSSKAAIDSDLSLMRGRLREAQAAAQTAVVSQPVTTTANIADIPDPDPDPEPDPEPEVESTSATEDTATLMAEPASEVESSSEGDSSSEIEASAETGSETEVEVSTQTEAPLQSGSAVETEVSDETSTASETESTSDSSTDVISQATTVQSAVPSPPSSGKSRIATAVGALKPDNLQIIEGIGPKMNEVLNGAGVNTWSELAAKSPQELRAILDAVNAKRYRIIDPSSWPDQAALANDGQWEELIALQKNLDSGRAQGATGQTDSKVEKLLVKMGVLKRWKQDDLTAIEGVGPKISGLLQDADIKTWRALSTTDVSRIQSILDAAGKRYKLADPGSWPKQAEMAADGRWDDLQEYQDFLQGGK